MCYVSYTYKYTNVHIIFACVNLGLLVSHSIGENSLVDAVYLGQSNDKFHKSLNPSFLLRIHKLQTMM